MHVTIYRDLHTLLKMELLLRYRWRCAPRQWICFLDGRGHGGLARLGTADVCQVT